MVKRSSTPRQINNRLTRLLLTFGLCLISLVVVGVILINAWTPVYAQSESFRISRLETETRTLRSRLSQLESQLRQLDRSSSNRIPEHRSSPSLVDGDSSDFASDPTFDRLATLVIETRQDVFALQEQVELIASQLNLTIDENNP